MNGKKPRILVVDDEEMVRNLIARFCETADCKVMTAENGRTALELSRQHEFDLVITDIDMPEMNGLALLGRLSPGDHDYEVILMSGLKEFEKARKAVKQGAFDFISKPVQMEDLINLIQKAMEKVDRKRTEKAYMNELEKEVEESADALRFMTDITEQERSRMRVIFNSVDQGLLALDQADTVVLMNTQMEKIMKISECDCLGKKITSAFPFSELVKAYKTACALDSGYKARLQLDRGLFELATFPITRGADNATLIGTLITLTDRTQEETAARIRSSLLSIVAHELRTPLTAMFNYLFLLESLLKPENSELIDQMRLSGNILKHSISELVRVAIYSDPEVPVNIQIADVRALINKAVRQSRKMAQTKQIEFHLSGNGADAGLLTDGDKFFVALDCVINNAVKFSQDGGRVAIDFRQDGAWYAVTVADQGCGIPENRIKEIFSEFTQIEDHLHRKHNGMGTGMFVVSRIMKLLSGRIDESSRENEGTRVELLLPLTPELNGNKE